jgi:hypothetical protein
MLLLPCEIAKNEKKEKKVKKEVDGKPHFRQKSQQ